MPREKDKSLRDDELLRVLRRKREQAAEAVAAFDRVIEELERVARVGSLPAPPDPEDAEREDNPWLREPDEPIVYVRKGGKPLDVRMEAPERDNWPGLAVRALMDAGQPMTVRDIAKQIGVPDESLFGFCMVLDQMATQGSLRWAGDKKIELA